MKRRDGEMALESDGRIAERRGLRSKERILKSLGVGGLVLAAHFGGVAGTNAAPVRIGTVNYEAEVSLAYTQFDKVVIPSAFGDASFGFDSVVPTPAVIAQPRLQPRITHSYAEDGLEGLALSETQMRSSMEDLVTQLGERYAAGAFLAMLLVYGVYSAGLRRLSPRVGAALLAAMGPAFAYEGGSAVSTYSIDNYHGPYQIDGLAGSLRQQGETVIRGIDKRSSQIQPYLVAWAALRNDLANVITPNEQEATTLGPKFMLVSDIHNINMYSTIAKVAKDEGATAVIDSGDLLVAGYVEEAEFTGILESIARLPVPYIFVLGNHDKHSLYDTTLIERLSAIPNVVILQPGIDQFQVAHFGDLTIAGVNDFMRWYGDDNKDNAAKQGPVAELFNKTFAGRAPDIAVSHEPAASEKLVHGGVTIAGHLHKDRVDGDHIVIGTLTGGGLFGQNDSTAPGDVSSEQSYGILSFKANCAPSRLDVARFHGTFNGKPQLDSMSFYFFGDNKKAVADVAPRDCSDMALRREIVTTPRDGAR